MTWRKLNRMLVIAAAILLTAGLAIYFYLGWKSNSHGPAKGLSKFVLPRGPVTPSVGIGATHGIILAGEGSLWAWGEDNDGWSVMGLGSITNQTVLHRIG